MDSFPTEAWPVPTDRLVPHRPPMALVTDLAWADGGGAVVLASVGARSLFVRPDATVEPLALLESIAQACAAYGGWRAATSRQAGTAAQVAFLAGVKSFEALETAVADTPMEIRVTLTHRFGGLHLFEGELSQDGRLKARASLKAYHPEESPAQA